MRRRVTGNEPTPLSHACEEVTACPDQDAAARADECRPEPAQFYDVTCACVWRIPSAARRHATGTHAIKPERIDRLASADRTARRSRQPKPWSPPVVATQAVAGDGSVTLINRGIMSNWAITAAIGPANSAGVRVYGAIGSPAAAVVRRGFRARAPPGTTHGAMGPHRGPFTREWDTRWGGGAVAETAGHQ